MSVKRRSKRSRPSQTQLDDVVVSQAGDEAAWEPSVHVQRVRPGSFLIPPALAQRAAFLARVHHASGVEEWLNRVIRERIELEEVAYAAVKRDMKSKPSSELPAAVARR